MMVTFVSECEKKALNKTRRVLDAFANRIGTRTWQTVITNEGLQAVKKLLRKTGFVEIQRMSCKTSNFEGFPFFTLDVDISGSPRKGEASMYVEAKKPRRAGSHS